MNDKTVEKVTSGAALEDFNIPYEDLRGWIAEAWDIRSLDEPLP